MKVKSAMSLSGKLNTRVVQGEARAEVNMDLSDALKVSNMEFTMAVYGVMPEAAPRLDNLRAQKPDADNKKSNPSDKPADRKPKP